MPIRKVVQDVGEVVGVNATILSVTTFTNLETLLKILLLVISIIYTADKWWYHKKQRDEKKKAEQ
jgi:hypothetical protein